MFDAGFDALTGYPPFPWQRKLYDRFVEERADNIPSIACLPTGLGKTNVIGVWLLALLKRPDRMPRRLVYVVNRRTVVDQTTAEVNEYCRRVTSLEANHPVRLLVERLGISTLRGQFADNRAWSEDPSKPAVICGTVDMIGSRLLFQGYGLGFKSRPLHAGFLGQDALLVHDEAHLEPAFQHLIEAIQREQHQGERIEALPWPRLRVMALSATAREGHGPTQTPFGLTDDDRRHPIVRQRLEATKALHLHRCDDEKKELVDQVVGLALQHEESGDAILVFLRRVDDALTVLARLDKELPEHVAPLTGTMRGHERDELVRSNKVFARFMPKQDRPEGLMPAEGTVYLVCTSAGEVGVNISADHMVCDLSTFDSMAQRLGRVNRFGDRDDTRVDVVYPESLDDKKPNPQRAATLTLLRQLNGNASPKVLGELLDSLSNDQRKAAFAPEPRILPVTDILFDAWALTTLRGKMPGRPPVAPYLHGIAEWEPPRTSVGWRTEVDLITPQLLERHGVDFPRALLEDYALKPHEVLTDTSGRVMRALQALAADHPKAPVWLIDAEGQILVSTLDKVADPAATKALDRRPLERAIAESVVLLPPSVGGLTGEGTLDGTAEHDVDHPNGYDIADRWLDEDEQPRRHRRFTDERQPPDGPEGMALIRIIDADPLADEFATPDEEVEVDVEAEPNPRGALSSPRGRFWHWYTRPRDAEGATRASAPPVTWDHHTRDVTERATDIVAALNLPDDLKQAVILAAELHDLGKKRELWQRSIGNPNPTDWHAKPGKPSDSPRWRSRRLSDYRHEFGSLLDVLSDDQHSVKLAKLSAGMQDVVLHLIAAHHGYTRPHFPPKAYDHERYTTQQNQQAAHEVTRRFARLQRRYGRWGLAYLESLLRAADWAASANPSNEGGKS